MKPLLRDRDFWALVLAKLRDKELRIHGYDDVPTREAKISQLLDSFGDSAAQPSLWSYLDGMGYEVLHHQYYVNVSLDDPDSGPELAEAILVALRENDDDALSDGNENDVDSAIIVEVSEARIDGDTGAPSDSSTQLDLDLTLRDRDYWALVLAELSDKELEIYTYDDVPTREAKIAELLDSFGDSAAP